MRINYNVQAMNANLALNKADSRVSSSIGRLSSGLKVAAAKDNPSGYALSKRMNMQIEGISRAIQSSNDASNIISIADGALQEVSDMVQRISELATKAANATMTDEDRKLCQDEIGQLKQEIQRVADTTEFNGQTLMDGSFDVKGYTNNLDVKVATYSDSVPVGRYTIASLPLTFTDGELDKSMLTSLVGIKDADGTDVNGIKVKAVDGTLLTIGNDEGDFSITMDVEGLMPAGGSGSASISDLRLDITGLGPMDMQIGANEDQILSIRIPALSLKLMSLDDARVYSSDPAEKLSGEELAGKLMNDCKTALAYVNDMRSRLGAYQNRLEHTVASLDVTNEALTGAYSGLVDADMAEETVTYSTAQVISQAATSVLAQANERPSQALQLLQ